MLHVPKMKEPVFSGEFEQKIPGLFSGIFRVLIRPPPAPPTPIIFPPKCVRELFPPIFCTRSYVDLYIYSTECVIAYYTVRPPPPAAQFFPRQNASEYDSRQIFAPSLRRTWGRSTMQCWNVRTICAGARYRVGIELLYWPARLNWLAESIPGLHKSLKMPSLINKLLNAHTVYVFTV